MGQWEYGKVILANTGSIQKANQATVFIRNATQGNG